MRSKIITLLWGLFLLTLPFQLGRHYWFPFSYVNGLKIDYLSPTFYLQDIVLILLFGAYLLKRRTGNKKISAFIFSVPFVLSVLFALLNILFSFSPILSFYSFLRFGQFILLVYLAGRENKRIISALKTVLPISAISQLAISVIQIVTNHSVGGPLYWLGERSFTIATPDIAKTFLFNHVWLRPYGTFSHPNSLAGFMLLILVLSLVFLSGKIQWLTVISSLLIIIISFSQSAWLGLFIVLFYIFFSRSSKQNRIYIGFTSVALTIFFALSFPNLINHLIIQLTASPSFLLRLSLLKTSWSIFLSHPIIGVGLGNFILALGQQQDFARMVHWYQPVHNIFVLWIVETGVIGIGIIFLLARKLFIINVLQYNSLPKHQLNTHLIIFILIIILTTGSLDHYWLTLIQNRLLLALVLGLQMSCNDKKVGKTLKTALK